jgi:hypothetical protein
MTLNSLRLDWDLKDFEMPSLNGGKRSEGLLSPDDDEDESPMKPVQRSISKSSNLYYSTLAHGSNKKWLKYTY